MAREKHIALQPGRRQRTTFDHLISPLGGDVAQTPTYSPSREVGTRQPKGRASQTESARNNRRGT